MLKSIAIVLPKNVLVKMKYMGDNRTMVWLFGPMGGIKNIICKVSIFVNYYKLLILFFRAWDMYHVKKKIAYCESVARKLKVDFINSTKSYLCYMRIRGVGYKLEVQNSNSLVITIGYSHKISIKIPLFIKICILKKRTIIWSYSLMHLQQFCYMLSSLRSKDPYNGKGIVQPHLQKKLKIGKISRI